MSRKTACIIFFLLICVSDVLPQTAHYSQFWNEFALTHTFKGRFSTEINLGQTYTSLPDSKNIFYASSQIYGRAWIHYYASARWKLSYFFAYYYNKYVPEVDQREYPEMRSALQAVYYLNKIRYTLLARFRMEDRHILDKEGVYEGVYRFRGQMKLIYPLNNRIIRKGVIYGIGSDELFVKSVSNVTGAGFFDRNRLTLGAGYSITDDIQMELTYVNEILPRNPVNEIYNALQVNVSFNNLFENIGKKLFTRKEVKAEAGTDD